MAALVYIAAFAPDKGESVNTLIADPPPRSTRPADPSPPPDESQEVAWYSWLEARRLIEPCMTES